MSIVRAAVTACALAFASLSPALPAAASHLVHPSIHAPVSHGTLRIAGDLRDGQTVTATGLSWRPARLPAGTRLLSFAVSYRWQSCNDQGRQCRAAADSTAAPFAAHRYVTGHRDTGRRLRLTETAAEVVETSPATFSFRVVRRSVTRLSGGTIRPFIKNHRPVTEFVNGTPERHTASAEEYFQVDPPHYNRADGRPSLRYRVGAGRWRPVPRSRALYTGRLRPGPHLVTVRTANRAGATEIRYRWHVVRIPRPVPCRPRPGRRCWYPQHRGKTGRPMRWDWQIGRVTPRQRTGRRAVDIYDVDGFLTTAPQIRRIHTRWQAATVAHPAAICYLDLAWEDYRPDASPAPRGRYFPAAALGRVYYGYPQERWLDFRQLGALKPMLAERIGRCAAKGFDAVELDDIDSFDPTRETGFRLTPGDAQNFLAYAFNLIHRDGMTALWKNSPLLSWWGRRYADGAVVEECYAYHACFASWLRGNRQYGITCTGLHGRTPCGWDDFAADVTPAQPTGKWVGEAEYGADHYVCNPGQRCRGPHRFAAFCATVSGPRAGFAAVKFDVDLDGRVFYPCPRGI
jgi:hypothetical protein